MMTHEDKERDDALIAEAERLATKATQSTTKSLAWIEECQSALIHLVRSNWQPAPKPDRAEKLWWTLCYCDNQTAIALLRSTMDELRAEWEAERPAVVVPREAKLWADSVGYCSATRYEERTTAKWIKSLDGAKGDE